MCKWVKLTGAIWLLSAGNLFPMSWVWPDSNPYWNLNLGQQTELSLHLFANITDHGIVYTDVLVKAKWS